MMEELNNIISNTTIETIIIKFKKYYSIKDVIRVMGYKKSSLYHILSRIPNIYKKKYISKYSIYWLICNSNLKNIKIIKNFVFENNFKCMNIISKQNYQIKKLNRDLEDIKNKYNTMMYDYYNEHQNIYVENEIIYQTL
ncbi:unknown similar to AMEV259 [Choristoneura rosaceana entomopoxvirus 'L']|uniref:N1R/p28-like protein n=1 Tax=Choristoneura rosaceana entomopoxvirus 'L' TaxID=1293539 RepID=A0ABM9QKW4_9POXV|nr:unknown similar to AMEV259 [Choristoneura rosaceana entomopoxvirus 'L']CCU56165.1 unknown similar to AMEV259 [Choristoneura rosaceana entomopoxvirus 'L']